METGSNYENEPVENFDRNRSALSVARVRIPSRSIFKCILFAYCSARAAIDDNVCIEITSDRYPKKENGERSFEMKFSPPFCSLKFIGHLRWEFSAFD